MFERIIPPTARQIALEIHIRLLQPLLLIFCIFVSIPNSKGLNKFLQFIWGILFSWTDLVQISTDAMSPDVEMCLDLMNQFREKSMT